MLRMKTKTIQKMMTVMMCWLQLNQETKLILNLLLLASITLYSYFRHGRTKDPTCVSLRLGIVCSSCPINGYVDSWCLSMSVVRWASETRLGASLCCERFSLCCRICCSKELFSSVRALRRFCKAAISLSFSARASA